VIRLLKSENMPAPSPSIRQYCKQRGFSSRVCEGGLDYLVARWQKDVAEICAGYSALFDEYLDDMDGRKIIAELLPLASDSERAQVAALLPTLDAQFFEATRPTDSCIWGEHNAAKYGFHPDQDWWYYRVPANLGRVEDPGQWPHPASTGQ